MRKCVLMWLLALLCAGAWAQEDEPQVEPRRPLSRFERQVQPENVTLPAGTKIPLVLKQPISTKTAKPGDAVYAQTNFPVTMNDLMVIPPGTYVQGVISSIKRPGRVSGRAEVLFHFTTMIFPSGYTISLPGAVENVPGAEGDRVKDQEGTVQHRGEKGKDVGTIAGTGATGAAVGAAAGGAKGAGIGGGIGGATGLAVAMLTRGSDIRLGTGTAIDMVLSRPLTVDVSRARRSFAAGR